MFRLLLLAPLLVLITVVQLYAQANNFEVPDEEVVAKVDGHEITMGELDWAWEKSDKLSRIQLRQQMYDTRRRVLEVLIGEYLIGIEAQARGLTRDQLLEEELPRLLIPVSSDDIDSVYEKEYDRLTGVTPEEKRVSVKRMLDQQRLVQAFQTFVRKLRTASDIVRIFLEPPREVVRVVTSDPRVGPARAPVEIVEFSDFE